MRVNITLECTSCHERTYLTSKNRRHNPDRLELNKYCPRERKVTLHRETKELVKNGWGQPQSRLAIRWNC